MNPSFLNWKNLDFIVKNTATEARNSDVHGPHRILSIAEARFRIVSNIRPIPKLRFATQ